MYKLLVLAFVTGCIDETEPMLTEASAELTGTCIWSETETGSISGALSIQNDVTTASAGRYVRVDGTGYVRTFFSLADYEPEVIVWVRAIAPSTSANSVAIQIDNSANYAWEIPVSTTWEWHPVGGSPGYHPWSLLEGSHTLRINGIEPGVMIDRVLITTSSSSWPIADTIEAEAGSVVAPMRFGTQRIPYVTYAYVPNGSVNGGRLDLDVYVPNSDTVYVWGRANAPSTADNQFWVSVQGDPGGQTWAPPVTSSTGWTWSRLPTTIRLASDILSFNRAEDGTKLDKIVITNDPGFTLVESSPPPVKTL